MSLLVVLGSGLGPVGHGGWRVQEAEAGPGLEASCGHLRREHMAWAWRARSGRLQGQAGLRLNGSAHTSAFKSATN